MEPVTTYHAKGKTIGLEFLFKYYLNGTLKVFEIVNGELNQEQKQWLFSKNFPADESIMKNNWMKLDNYKKVFIITVAPAKVDFDAFWRMYPYNALSKKKIARERWEKLKQNEKIKLLINLPRYINLKKNDNTKFPYAEVFINQRWWDE